MSLKSINLTLLAFSLISILSFCSCEVEDSADVNQERIYADYEVFYNSNSDKTWVVARFKFGGPTGTNLTLNDPASATFNGDDLPYNALVFGHFREYAGKIDNGTFVYTNTNGSTFTNTLPAYETIDFPDDLDTLKKSQAYTLAWEGTSLSPDQRVGLFIGSWTWGQDAAFVQDGDGATDIVLGTNQMANLPIGPSTCYMDRSTVVDIVDGTSEGGKIRGTYRAKNVVVNVVD